MNQSSEYWYIGSMLASEAMQKKSSDVRYDTGLYPSRASSIFTSATSASFCFSSISLLTFLDACRMLIAPSSSRIEPPSADASTSRIWSSISLSCFLFAADSSTSRAFSSSRSGRSLATTMPRSWSSRPAG